MKPCKRYPEECPEPGLYPGVDANTYHRWAAIPASLLKQVAKSPRHAWHYLHQEADLPNGAMHAGTIKHAAVLQPDRLLAASVIDPPEIDFPATKRKRALGPGADGETWALAKDVFGPLCHTKAMREDCERWIKLIKREKPLTELLFDLPGMNEVAVVWESKRFPGVRFKALLDRVAFHTDGSVEVPDIKTTAQETEDDFIRQAWNMGYPEQLWHYREAVHAAHEFDPRFPPKEERHNLRSSVIALYNGPPRDAVLYELPESELSLCSQRHATLVSRLLVCYVKDWWPGKGDGQRQPLVWLPWMHARYQDGGVY